MSFVLSKEDISLNRIKAASVFFLPCIFIFMLLVVFFLAGAKNILKNQDIMEVEKKLDSYLETIFSNQGARINRSDAERDMQGLNFVRLVVPGEHILLTQGHGRTMDFDELVNHSPLASGAWLEIGNMSDQLWTLVSLTKDNGLVVQGGMVSGTSVELYKKLKKYCFTATFILVFTLWYPLLLLVKRAVEPLSQLRKQIKTELKSGNSEHLLANASGTGELNDLISVLNELLARNRKLIDEMKASLDNVAHDLRTPMTRLRSIAEYGLQTDTEEEKLRDALADCLEESERVLAMLRVMMSVAEAETGTMRLDLEVVDLEEVVGDVISLYEYVAEEKKVTLSKETEKVMTTADRMRITQVLANLVDNGIKYCSENGLVHISLKIDGETILLKVRDNGMGISESEIHRIWERLYRGDRSRSRQGLGLGLNFVKAVVEMHGGTVSVISKLREGSDFEVRLPLQHQKLIES